MQQVNLKEKIWNEKFRPVSIESCVLPEVIKRNFENFVIAKDCPNLMLHSTCGGTGKCLDPSESLNIKIPEEKLEFFQCSKTENQITLQRLFDFFEMDKTPYNTLKSIESEGFLVQSRLDKWVPIKGLIKKLDNKVKITTETGLSFKCGINHIILSQGQFKPIKEATHVFNEFTQEDEIITSREFLLFGNVFDIALDYPHVYLTPNGLTHHNTSTLKALCHDLNLEYLFINASEQRSIEILRNEVTQFVSTISLEGRNKAVLFDEFCNSQPITQNALRGFIEQYSQVRFFFSCNHLDKIIQPLQSRCTVVSFDWKKEDHKYLKNKFYNRTKQILDHEQIEFKKDVVVELINQYFPDFRRIINELQKYSISGSIDEGLLTYSTEFNLGELFKFIREKNFTEVRKFVEMNDGINYELFYKQFYNELKDQSDPKCLPGCILILGNYIYRHSTVLDKQINLLCCLIEIMAEIKFR